MSISPSHSLIVLHYCPHLTKADPLSLADQWKVYKHSRPVRGAILLNDNMNKVIIIIIIIINDYLQYVQCVLVQGYPASTSWGFPKGKKETNETDLEAAVREVRGVVSGYHGNTSLGVRGGWS